jgi:orotidine-5'-phosphate decarboxylase
MLTPRGLQRSLSTPQDRLIVACDFDSIEKVERLVNVLTPEVRFFKIGLQLFTSCGISAVQSIKKREAKIFLDLKLHDIPETVGRTIDIIKDFGVHMTTVHALGGKKMLEYACSKASSSLLVIAVTLLTSLDMKELSYLGIEPDLNKAILNLAKLAIDCGCDGIVCSPFQVNIIRRYLGPDPILITPGIRMSQEPRDDHKFPSSPENAIRQGADFIVVGRPIYNAPHPQKAAQRIIAKISEVILKNER